MTNSQAIILGVVQGLTEYLPVSSSAHLVLVPNFLGWELLPKESFVFDVLVQLGTLVGILVYFFNPIKDVIKSVLTGLYNKDPFYNNDAKIGWMVCLATIPAAIIGLLFKDQIAAYFSSPFAASFCLIITGIMLLLAEYVATIFKQDPTNKDAVVIGFAQSFALLPGVSRSGATIAAGMACGLSRKDAARFSFLMSIPVMLGASSIAFLDLFKDLNHLDHMLYPLVLGFISAAVSGYLVIRWFMNFLAKNRLSWFAAYCIVLGLFGLQFFV